MSDQPAQPAAPANAAEASAKLGVLMADPAWGKRLMESDAATVAEWRDLTALAADADPVEAAMAGAVPGLNDQTGMLPDAGTRVMADAASHLRGKGIPDGAIRQLLSDQEVTQQEYDAVKQWKAERTSDAAYTKRWLSGDALAAKEMILADIVLNSKIKGAKS